MYLALESQSLYKVIQSLEQVEKFDTLTKKNMEITELLGKNVSKVVTLKEFVTLNKVITLKEIFTNTQKGYLVIQAYNDKDKKPYTDAVIDKTAV